jgi:enoyl-CoA hydratase/carnithine racemase
VTCPEARFCANFTRLGFHPGFGLTVTLPAVIGETKAALMFYTSRRVPGDEAYAMGLADVLVRQDQVRDAAIKLAAEIGENSSDLARTCFAAMPRPLLEVGRICPASDRPYSVPRRAMITMMIRAAETTRTHSLLMAMAASAVP